MPQIIIRGMEIEDIKKISRNMIDELQAIIDCPREYFTIEALHSAFIQDGASVKGAPLVQVNWFDRGPEIQNQTAAVINRYIHSIGYDQSDIYFIMLEKERYYENGEHF